MAQSVERRIGSAEVTGPIPVSSLLQKLNPRRYGDSAFCVLSREILCRVPVIEALRGVYDLYHIKKGRTICMDSDADSDTEANRTFFKTPCTATDR